VRLDEQGDIVLGVIPLRSTSVERSFLIVFEGPSVATAKRLQPMATSNLTESEKDRRLAQLERELASTRGFLQTTMEEQEAVREDLKSAHEEVLSANEEFQSTNEELETAKEELQSSNEELTTTNEELLNRNRELAGLNAELHRTREIAVRAQDYADAIVASMRDPLLVLDSDLRVLRGNQSFFDGFRLKRETTEGKFLRDLGDGQWASQELLNRLQRVLVQGVPVIDYEMDYARGTAVKPQILRIDAKKLPGDAERAELLLLAIEDVTERRSRAHALELANQRKDEFLAMLAHELRNPLTPITHAIHLLQRKEFEGSSTALHTMIGRQTRRLVRLVDDLLDLARINRGHIELRSSLVDMTDVVRDAAETARVRMDERRHEMTIAVPDSPVCVDGDAVRLEQIVSNILDNAAKYTDPGGRIDVKLTEQSGEAVLSVRDNGIGLAPQDLARIFDLFDQVDRSLSRSGGGLGIGLTLVRRVLQLHGGTVDAQSAGLGHGAEFIVRLPISKREKAKASAPGDEGVAAVAERTRRVLIVDDNVDAVESLKMLTEHWGHDVVVAHSGPEAIAAVDTFHPETALVDIGLPGISGYEVARILRARHPAMFLVAMTGYGRDEDRKAALAAGFDAHLVKPANLDELESLLAKGHAFIRE
jgi:two-component system CheB/CheR fusion protein